MKCLENRVLRNDRQHVMEIDIRLLELRAIAERRTIGFERRSERFDFLQRGMLGGIARKADFEKCPGFLEMPDAVRRRQKIAHAAGEIFDHRFRRRRGDPRPRTRLQFDQAHALQVKQRLAHGRPPDAEFAHHLALGRQRLARHDIVLPDPLLHRLGDLLVELAAANCDHFGIPIIPES